MKHFKIKMKERGSDGVVRTLETEYIGNATRRQVKDFFGLDNDDILEYHITESAF